ncbi:hypothetical protein GGF32_001106 [Allomyces javanicus]|nr:hypothetical protein GGF32_001106 [Allomyces javanicus]
MTLGPRKEAGLSPGTPKSKRASLLSTAGSATTIPLAREITTHHGEAAELAINYRTLTHELTIKSNGGGGRKSAPDHGDAHKLTLHELALRFGTSLDRGLDDATATRRLGKFGANALSPPPTDWLSKIAGYLFGGFASLMWFAGIIVFISWQPLGGDNPPASNLALACAIMAVIVLQASFTAFQDYQTSRIMASINSMLPLSASVLRNGTIVAVPVANLVPGDIVHLRAGQKVPGDLRLVEVTGLKLDNSILTGEAIPIHATVESTDDQFFETHNIALMGTLVTEGAGLGVVVTTGDRTLMGQVAKLASSTRLPASILQKEIQRFVYIIATLCIVTATTCLVWYMTYLRNRYPTFLSLSAFLSTDMGVLVAYVPEGLPIAVTVVLTIVARRMLRQRVLVKNLSVVETLGCCSVICSDKTGTLTTNQMTVVDVALGIGEPIPLGTINDPAFVGKPLVAGAHLCNGAEFDEADMELPVVNRRIRGDATDSALLRFAATQCDMPSQVAAVTRVVHVPFNSKVKRMLTVLTTKADAGTEVLSLLAGRSVVHGDQVLLAKGAPDYLLPHCRKYVSVDGRDMPLTDEAREALVAHQVSLSSRGQRVLLIARRTLLGARNETVHLDLADDDAGIEALVSRGLVVLGLVGIVDPPRFETAGVVETVRGAGVRVFMVTGDFPQTAAAIAKQVGIFTHQVVHTLADLGGVAPAIDGSESDFEAKAAAECDPAVQKKALMSSSASAMETHQFEFGDWFMDASLLLSGTDLRKMNMVQWHRACQYQEIVFARTTPEQKLQIVQTLQDCGNIVAVTGDGVNDAPALKNAHLGIAMGSGSDVAMAASAMVLLDSNFSSIVEALRQGRVVFENLKKVCMYLLPAGTFSELMPVLMNLFLGVPLPLSGFLMIVICIMTDVGPSIALMYEDAESNLLDRPPRRPSKDNMVDAKLLLHAYLFLGVIQSTIAHGMFFLYMTREWGLVPGDLFFAFDQYADGFGGLSQADLEKANAGGQCVYFATLLLLQFGNLQATRLRRSSMLHHPPTRNPVLFIAMLVSLTIALLVVYLPACNMVMGTVPIPAMYWFVPIPLAVIIPLFDELRKWRVRTAEESILAKLAW